MQIKIRHHFILIRLVKFLKSENKWWRDLKNRTSLGDVYIGTITMENNLLMPIMIMMRTPYNPVILLPGIYPRQLAT